MSLQKSIGTFVLALVIASFAIGDADAQENATGVAAPPARTTGLAAVGRFGMMASQGSNEGTHYLAPDLGLGVAWFYHPNLGFSLNYDIAHARRGTSELRVDRVHQQLTAMAEGRVRVHRAISLRASVGGGGALLLTAAAVADDSRTASLLEPGFAWAGAVDLDIPETRFRAVLGGSGLHHRSSHDLLFFAGLSYAVF